MTKVLKTRALPDWLWIGGNELCTHAMPDRATVHACTGSCYRGAVGYSAESFPDSFYVGLENERNLYLNLDDPPAEELEARTFYVFLDFALAHRAAGRGIVIHCESGWSSAPSLGMLLLAAEGVIPSDDLSAARDVFEWMYPAYKPGEDIVRFLTHAWSVFMTHAEMGYWRLSTRPWVRERAARYGLPIAASEGAALRA
jgi:hypothetical protein